MNNGTRLIALALLLTSFATPAFGGNVWGHFASKHWNGGNYQETNPGLGIEVPIKGRWSLELGLYKNSFSLRSNYAWGGYSVYHGPVRIRYLAGIADRYSDTKIEDGEAVPVAGISLEYKRARVTVLPGVFGFSWKLMEF